MRVRTFDQWLGLEPPMWSLVAGEILMIIGGCIAATSIASFVVKGGGTPAPVSSEQFDLPFRIIDGGDGANAFRCQASLIILISFQELQGGL